MLGSVGVIAEFSSVDIIGISGIGSVCSVKSQSGSAMFSWNCLWMAARSMGSHFVNSVGAGGVGIGRCGSGVAAVASSLLTSAVGRADPVLPYWHEFDLEWQQGLLACISVV